jgi:hypothetical protein
MAKKITDNQITGERSIALIHARVARSAPAHLRAASSS